jgi:hypothetical protein
MNSIKMRSYKALDVDLQYQNDVILDSKVFDNRKILVEESIQYTDKKSINDSRNSFEDLSKSDCS